MSNVIFPGTAGFFPASGGGAATSAEASTNSATGFVLSDPTAGQDYLIADTTTDLRFLRAGQRFAFDPIQLITMATNKILTFDGTPSAGQTTLTSNGLVLTDFGDANKTIALPDPTVGTGFPLFVINVGAYNATFDDMATTVLTPGNGVIFFSVPTYNTWVPMVVGA